MQQRVCLRGVADAAGDDDDDVRQPLRRVNPYMSFAAKVPDLTLLGLVHFGIAFLILVLGRRRSRNQGRVYDSALAHD